MWKMTVVGVGNSLVPLTVLSNHKNKAVINLWGLKARAALS